MECLLTGNDHGQHEDIWTVFSSHYSCPVCLGCVVGTLENDALLPLQKKPSLTEMLRLLTHQSLEMIQIFMAEEMVVWHLLTVLMDNMKTDDEVFQAVCTEAILKMTQLIGSEDLVTSIVDTITGQMESTRDHNTMVPYYMLIGKLLYQLPGLANKLILDYGGLLDKFGEDLCICCEKVQSELVYIFILLVPFHTLISPRLQQNLHTGTLGLLSTARRKESQINGLGLLRLLLDSDDGCQAMMSLRTGDHSLLTVLKKLLLCKEHHLQTHVGQVLLQLLVKSDGNQYGKAILDSDIAEFLFESLHTSNTDQIHCIMKVLQQLACLDHFYKRCHAVYGIESVLRCLTTSEELKNPSLHEEGFQLMTRILQRQPSDIPLFVSQNVVKNCLKIIHSGIEIKQLSVSVAAQKCFTAFLRKDYLVSPVPFIELGQCIISIALVIQNEIKPVREGAQRNLKRKLKGTPFKQDDLLDNLCDIMSRATSLALQCKLDPRACESSYLPPNSTETSSSYLTLFVEQLLQLMDETFIPVVVVYWNDIKKPDIYWKFIQLFTLLHGLEELRSCDLVNKLVEVGFLSNIVDVIAKHRDFILGTYGSDIKKFLQLAVECSKDKTVKTCSLHDQPLISPENLRWTFDELGKGFVHQDVKQEEIEAYLTILCMSYKYGNRLLCADDLGHVLSSIVEIHTSLEQLSPLSKKQFLYLLAWLSTNSKFDMWLSIPNGLKGLPGCMNGPMESWYTDDIIMLKWCYMDPILSSVCGQNMLSAYLSATCLERLQEEVDTLTDNSDMFYLLLDNKHFTRHIVEQCSHSVLDITRKLTVLQNVLIDNCNHCKLEEIINLTEETLQNVFLKKYADSKCHNIVALLELYVKTYHHTRMGKSFDKKILYHVLRLMTEENNQTTEIQHVSLIAILAALSTKSDNQAVCMIVKQDHVLKYLQTCISDGNHLCYSIACDIITLLIKCVGAVEVHKPIAVNITKIHSQLSEHPGDPRGLGLLSALFCCRLTSNVIRMDEIASTAFYKKLYLTLQQRIITEFQDVSAKAVDCMVDMLSYISIVRENLYSELLHQPWNQMMLEVILDTATTTGLKYHHIALYSFFTKDKDSSEVLSLLPGSFRKLVLLSTGENKDLDKDLIIHKKRLISQILSNCNVHLLEAEQESLKQCLL